MPYRDSSFSGTSDRDAAALASIRLINATLKSHDPS